MTNPDLMGMGREAMDIAAGLNLEVIREGKEAIQGPAVGRKLARAERIAQHRVLLGNPLEVQALSAQLSAQYQLTPEKPISRRLVSRLLRAHRELAEEEAQDAER